LTPEAIVIGGVSAPVLSFLPAVQAEIERGTAHSRAGLYASGMGNTAGMVGAAKLACQF